MDSTFWSALWQNLMRFGISDNTYSSVTVVEKVVRPILVYLILVIVLRMFGKRVLAQFNAFDLVVLLMLSNTVQNAIIGNDTSLSGGVLGAMALIGANALLVRITYRGPKHPSLGEDRREVVLIQDGKPNEGELRRMRINCAELLVKVHERGFDSIEDIESAVLSPAGTIHFRGKRAAIEDGIKSIVERLEELRREIAQIRKT